MHSCERTCGLGVSSGRPVALALQVRLPYHESLVAVFDHPLLPNGGPCLRYCTVAVLAKGERAGGRADTTS